MALYPSVSVIIPTYNRADYLQEAVLSVLAQTSPAQEIVIVDDGSTDHTPEVVAALRQAGAPIVYLQEAHCNRLGVLRNRAIAASQGEWLALLDSDDRWVPQRLERQWAAWAAQPEVELAFCNVQQFDGRGLFPQPYLPPQADYSGPVLGALLEEPLAVPSALMITRAAYDRVGGFADRRINEDYELTLRIAAISRASYVPQVLVHMRSHGGSRSQAHNELAMSEYLAVVTAFLRQHPHRPPSVRARARRGLANVHVKLVRLYLAAGQRGAARRHLVALAALRPWDRRAPALLWRALAPGG